MLFCLLFVMLTAYDAYGIVLTYRVTVGLRNGPLQFLLVAFVTYHGDKTGPHAHASKSDQQ